MANEGRYFFSHQVTEGGGAVCVSDPGKLLTQEAKSSRFYGKGRIDADAGMYDMQSQMFDQQIHMWRWTGNQTHEALLRPALSLHVDWAEDCFDDDGNGLYRSYINTWPTDSVWFNGGETVEETSYQVRAYRALRDMAILAGDAQAAATYGRRVETIEGNFSTLWIPSRGHPASWREEIGHRRLRPDAWLYSVFLPIEAELLTLEQAAQALHYTEWGLERVQTNCSQQGRSSGCGERVWTSNWVPSIWSVRQMVSPQSCRHASIPVCRQSLPRSACLHWLPCLHETPCSRVTLAQWPGDNYALALAYFLAGLPDDAWNVMQGTLVHDMLQTAVPGVIGAHNGGTDFNDCVHPFARLPLEGVFGYKPNYPQGQVHISPQIPSHLRNVSIAAPDVSISVVQMDSLMQYDVSLKRQPANLTVTFPVRAPAVLAVRINGTRTANWTTSEGLGATLLHVSSGVPVTAGVFDVVLQGKWRSPAVALEVQARAGEGWLGGPKRRWSCDCTSSPSLPRHGLVAVC